MCQNLNVYQRMCVHTCAYAEGFCPQQYFSLKPEGLWGGACLHFADGVFSILSSSLVMEL